VKKGLPGDPYEYMEKDGKYYFRNLKKGETQWTTANANQSSIIKTKFLKIYQLQIGKLIRQLNRLVKNKLTLHLKVEIGVIILDCGLIKIYHRLQQSLNYLKKVHIIIKI
jgi:hypothetical protein